MDYLRSIIAILCFAFAGYMIYQMLIKRRYEKIARRMYAEGTLNAGSVWKHYRNKKSYTIQLVTNAFGTGDQWPLTVVYMTGKGYAVFSRPAHEFIRKFRLLDDTSNAEPTALSKIVSLARYVQDRIPVPDIDSKWIREYSTPTGKFNTFGHMRMEQHEETVTVHSVTNINHPVPYVNYTDSRGTLRTITLHNFRQTFRKERRSDVIHFIELSKRNLGVLCHADIREGDTLSVKEIVDNEQVTFESSGIEATLVLNSGLYFNVGDEYDYKNGTLTLRKPDEQ